MAEKDAEAPKTPTAHSLDRKFVQPPSPDVPHFPSAVSTPVSSSDLVAMENLRKKASAGIGGDRPGRYGFYGEPSSRAAAFAASQAAMEEGHPGSALPASPATFNVEHAHDSAEDPHYIPLIHVDWPNSSSTDQLNPGDRSPDAFSTPRRLGKSPAKGYPTPEPPAPPYSNPQKQKGTGLLSAPQQARCCARCPKPLTVIAATLIIALVLIIGLLIGHFAAPYIGTMTIMQPAGAAAPGMATSGGAGTIGTSDGRAIEGTGIGLEADQPITRDISPAPAEDPFLDAARMGTGVAGP